MFVYRYNGALPNGDRGRRKSRFALYKRPKANGVKPSTVHVISTPQASKVGGSYRIGKALADGDFWYFLSSLLFSFSLYSLWGSFSVI